MGKSALDDILSLYDGMDAKGKADIRAKAKKIIGVKKWVPNPGPQTEAYFCKADELFYGGAAGGGKSDLVIGLAINEHVRSAVLRREGTDLKGLEARMIEVMGSSQGYNSQRKEWKLGDNKHLDFGSCPHDKDKYGWQGRPHDLKAFDEITQFTRAMYQYIIGWNRSTKDGQRCRVVVTGNPPSTPEGNWVKEDWAPWLDPRYESPAKDGELRWFTTIAGETVWVDGPESFEDTDGEIVVPKSRTFIAAKLEDNPMLGADYRSKLQAMPEPLRSQLLFGDFNVTESDQENQTIPTAWVRLAQQRWSEQGETAPMLSVGADIAQGGKDKTVAACRHLGDYIARIKTKDGAETPDGPTASAFFIPMLRDGACVNIDMGGGFGQSTYDHLHANGVTCKQMIPSGASPRVSKSNLKYVNNRAAWYWGLRESLDPQSDRRVALPPDEEMVADLCAPTWKLMPRGIQIEAKEDVKKRLGRSPDKGDAVVMAFAEPRDDELTGTKRRYRGVQPTQATQNYDPFGAWSGR